MFPRIEFLPRSAGGRGPQLLFCVRCRAFPLAYCWGPGWTQTTCSMLENLWIWVTPTTRIDLYNTKNIHNMTEEVLQCFTVQVPQQPIRQSEYGSLWARVRQGPQVRASKLGEY